MAQTLNQLVDGLRQRDPKAIRALVEQFEGTARGLAKALLNDTHLAEDAVQEAFLDAVRRVETLRDVLAFPGWFRQIVRTQAGRITRRRSERTLERLPDCPGADPTPLQRLEDEETRFAIRQALARLTPPTLETAALFYMQGYSLAEVAAILDVPTGTVKRRLHDARNRLRDILTGSGRTLELACEDGKQTE